MSIADKNATVWKLASFGEVELLKASHEAGQDLGKQDERGFTPFNWAARNGHQPVISFLLENGYGASMEVPSFGGMRPLHHACNKNLERVVRQLIKEGADVNSLDENGDTPLHYTTARGVLNIVVALLDAGAKLLAVNGQGATPLHKAAIFGHVAVVKKLVESGANINAADSAGDTALHYASRCNFPLIVRLLLDSGASMAKNAGGLSPKDVACNAAMQQMFA